MENVTSRTAIDKAKRVHMKTQIVVPIAVTAIVAVTRGVSTFLSGDFIHQFELNHPQSFRSFQPYLLIDTSE